MSLNVGATEAFWIVTNLVAVVFTLVALGDARADRKAARKLNGVRLSVATGDVRRELVRLMTQTLLLSLVLPGLSSNVEVPLTPFSLALIAVSLLLLLNTALDLRERRRLARVTLAALEAERKGPMTLTITDVAGESTTTQDVASVTASPSEPAT